MQNPVRSILLLLLYLFCIVGCVWIPSSANGDRSEIKLSLVGDVNTGFGRMMSLCMEMAISDFYSAHPNYDTRLRISTKDAKTLIDFNLAILESAKREEVVGILSPQGSSDEAFAAAVGESLRVPIISFTSRNSPLLHAENNYLVRTTLSDAVQAQALAAICQNFKWSRVVLLYEDTGYSSSCFLTHAIKALQDSDIGLARMNSIPTSANDNDILKELEDLEKEQTKVFVVHTNTALGHRVFELANTVRMMSGYAWIMTDGLSIFMNSVNFNADGSMDGVLGIRPYVFASKNVKSFQQRWKRYMLVNKLNTPIMELNIYGLWAYDAVAALAVAIEEAGHLNSSLSYGSRLLSKLSTTKFRGLTGNFQLVDGMLKPSAYEIFNIIGNGERRVGFWTPERGIVRELRSPTTNELRKIMWPGDSVVPPKGWKIPAHGNLRVGIPCKPGFKEFVNVNPKNCTNATGFVIDIFLEALKVLPFPVNYDFYYYNDSISRNWSYDCMLHRIPREYDMVVGDTTIWAPRTEYVDFSLPYSESGVILVVRNRKPVDIWIFIRPLRWDLWVAILSACIFMGVALNILERRRTTTEEGSAMAHSDRPGLLYWSPIAILAFPERNMVSNNWSVFTLVCWLFMAFILMQSFTANLSAILTVDQLKFAFSEDYYVGYHEGSFLKNFLVQQLHINETRLRTYASVEGFHDAMLKGSKNGGIDAIFDEIPYMKLFLNRYESQYKMVGPTYRTDGLGFAFEKGSPLVAYFSRAILNVTQGPKMNDLEKRNFGPGYSSQDPMSSVISQGTASLTLREFAGLFLTIGSLTLLALFCSETSVGQKISGLVSSFIQNDIIGKTAQVHSMSVEGDTPPGGGYSSHEFTPENNANDDSENGNETGIDDAVVALDDCAAIVENQ